MSYKQEYDRVLNNDLKRTEILDSCGSACSNIFVLAVHNKKQWRDGKMKWDEPQTEALVKMLNIKNDCWGLYKTSSDYEDAHRDEICNTKNVIHKFLRENNDIKLIVSLHQLNKDRNTEIELNTELTKDKKIIEIFKNEIKKENIVCTENEIFTGNNPFSRWLNECFPKIDFIQIEINSKVLTDENWETNYEDSERVFKTLSNSIKEISKYYNNGSLYPVKK